MNETIIEEIAHKWAAAYYSGGKGPLQLFIKKAINEAMEQVKIISPNPVLAEVKTQSGTAISKETLLEYGMIKTIGDSALIWPMEKVISVDEEGNPATKEEEKMAICITHIRNDTELCLMLPDGNCLYLRPESIEELKTFEKCIESYEPNY